jgi:hypothetical protein
MTAVVGRGLEMIQWKGERRGKEEIILSERVVKRSEKASRSRTNISSWHRASRRRATNN